MSSELSESTAVLRAPHDPPGLSRLRTLADVAVTARALLDPVYWDFFAGGAGDEHAVSGNEAAFRRRGLVPRVLRAVGSPDLRTRLLAAELSMPVLLAPTAFHRLAHPDGELATARAAAAAGTIMVVSMAATTAVEAIAAANTATADTEGGTGRQATEPSTHRTTGGGRLWFQFYPQPDRAFTESLVRRVEAAGCQALVVTVDSPVFGRRERDLRNGFLDLPAGLVCENMRDRNGRVRGIAMSATADWDWIDWLRGITALPIVLKGILHPADARLAVRHGVAGLIVSNHGGRQLDRAIATLDALPAIVAAVAGRLPVLLDGGIRRGTDVVTALALGASAVAIGRPVLWGLAAGGAAGVRHVLELLRAEISQVMALVGAASPAGLAPDLVTERANPYSVPCADGTATPPAGHAGAFRYGPTEYPAGHAGAFRYGPTEYPAARRAEE